MSGLKEYLEYYKTKLEKYKNDSNIVGEIVEKLNKISVTPNLLLKTGVYQIVSQISKLPVPSAAKVSPLHMKWKAAIIAEQNIEKSCKPQKPAETQNGFPAYQRYGDSKVSESRYVDPSSKFLLKDTKSPIIANGTKPVKPPDANGIVLSRMRELPENKVNNFSKIYTKRADFRNDANQIPNAGVDSLPKTMDAYQGTSNGMEVMSKYSVIHPPINNFVHPVNNCRSSFSAHTTTNNIFEQVQNKSSDFSANLNTHTSSTNALSSPLSLKFQNLTDSDAVCTASPSKMGRIRDPYEIELKEGMFRTIKLAEDFAPEVSNVKSMYDKKAIRESWDFGPKKVTCEEQTFKKDQPSSKHLKSPKPSSEKKCAEKKTHNSKQKTHTPEKTNSEKSEKMKSEKRKLFSSSDKSAIELSAKKRKDPEPPKVDECDNLHKSNCKENPSANNDTGTTCDSKINPSEKTCDKKPSSKVSSDDGAEKFISSKKERTAVYSGKKTQEIPALQTLCVQMLKKNLLDKIKYTHPVPYKHLKPVLLHFTASQLRRIEENNPYLLKDADEIWKSFCRRKYPEVKLSSSSETWRELFWKTREEQNKKLKNVTASISASMMKSAPERQIKLAVLEETPDKHKHKRMRVSEVKTESTAVKSSSKESLIHKNSIKESNSVIHKVSKESSVSSHKKAKKAPAPLMTKLKKSLGQLAMHKK